MATCGLAVVSAPQLLVRLDGDYLRVSVAPHLNFISGRALERLKDGASVAFIGQLTIVENPNAIVPEARSAARFALSYDIWEEKFAATRMGDRPDSRRSVSHLSAFSIENWCLDNLVIERAQVPADRAFYVQLDLRAEDPREQNRIMGDSGINITQLIDVFRAPVRGGQKPWHYMAGPMRLADLRKG
jgi:hypothetical protein